MTSKLGALALVLTVATATVTLAAPAFAHGNGMGHDMGHTIDTSKNQSSQHGSNTTDKTMTNGQTRVGRHSDLPRIVMAFERKQSLAEILRIGKAYGKALAVDNEQLLTTLHNKILQVVGKFFANGGTPQEISTAVQVSGVFLPALGRP